MLKKVALVLAAGKKFEIIIYSKNKADNSAIGAELTSQRSDLTFEVRGNHGKKFLI